jgi:anti-sigma B factor antagonist
MNASTDSPADTSVQMTEHGPNARVVTVVGQIDTPTALRLATSLSAQLTIARVVIVDLDGVRFLGSGGLSALFEANELALRQDRILRLVSNSRIVNRALAAAGLREYFTFASSVPDALKNSACMQDVIEAGIAWRLQRNRSGRSLLRNSSVVRFAVAPSGLELN